jgi:hypothetical protein
MMLSFSCVAVTVVGPDGGEEGEREIHAGSDISEEENNCRTWVTY